MYYIHKIFTFYKFYVIIKKVSNKLDSFFRINMELQRGVAKISGGIHHEKNNN